MKANFFAESLGYDVSIILTEGYGMPPFFPLSEKVHVINLNLGFEELWEKPFWVKVLLYLKKQYRYKKRLRAELIRISPDITISTLRREINFINGIDDGSVKIGELHLSRADFRGSSSGNPNVLSKWFHAWWRRRAVASLRKLGKFVTLTDKAMLEWPELSNTVMIPDPLALDVKVLSTQQQSKRVIAIGRYAYEKGYDLLLRAWALVEKRYPDWSLEVFGMGNRQPYEQLLAELNLNPEKCRLHGALSDVKIEYQNGSLLVLPSRTEGFGLVLLEAMAFGIPVVAFDCGSGPSSIISDGENGFLVQLFDIRVFAERMMQLMEDDGLRRTMGNNGIQKARQYTIDKIGLQWKQLFDDLMQNGI
jgi:glycosyltransferase involved in cell wall biosynthesis